MEDDNELKLKSRMSTIFEKLKISANKLQKETGISHSTISSQVNGKSKLAAATIVALLKYDQSISAEWIMRGEGTMLKEGESKHNMNITLPSGDSDVLELKNTIARQQREIDGLYERIDELKGAKSAQYSIAVG